MFPFPAGALAVMVKLCGMNLAVTVVFEAGLMLQGFVVPVQPPLQLEKESPGTAVAVSESRFPVTKFADAEVQAEPQLIAAGLLTTVPRPPPVESFCTVTATTVPMSLVTAARSLVVSGSVVPEPFATLTTLVTRLVPLPETTLALSRYVAGAPEGRVTVVLMLPLPLAAPQLPPPVAE